MVLISDQKYNLVLASFGHQAESLLIPDLSIWKHCGVNHWEYRELVLDGDKYQTFIFIPLFLDIWDEAFHLLLFLDGPSQPKADKHRSSRKQ